MTSEHQIQFEYDIRTELDASSREIARRLGYRLATTPHLLLAFLGMNGTDVANFLESKGVNARAVEEELRRFDPSPGVKEDEKVELAPLIKSIFTRAAIYASRRRGSHNLYSADIVNAWLVESSVQPDFGLIFLKNLGVDLQELSHYMQERLSRS